MLVSNERLTTWLEEGKIELGTAKGIEGGLGGPQAGLDELRSAMSGETLVVDL